ncbi:unnamed protein product [Microthlaspi erraticum]|uniref:Uncharacterized protein n=1 Tax=Microthlaspi erraticum TaxID=1685480 RepID=A0A6D2JIE2_9BRAS|nr:unnamed protein product [Microthlaspi erraticum]CAA7037025.1 unnamed protein product [Microthlaspi erraticum]
MSLNHWSNHGVKGIQQSYQENHEPSLISNNAPVEVNEEMTPLGFNGKLGEPQHEEEAKDVGTGQDYGLESIQWAHEEESDLEEVQEDAFSLNEKCVSYFFFPSLEIKENSFAERDEGAVVKKTNQKKLHECVNGVLDGECLQSLFGEHMESAQEKDVGRAIRANLGTTRKMNEPQPLSIDPSPNKLRLIPLRYKDGKIEYKIKCKGKSKPFSSVKALVSSKLQKD